MLSPSSPDPVPSPRAIHGRKLTPRHAWLWIVAGSVAGALYPLMLISLDPVLDLFPWVRVVLEPVGWIGFQVVQAARELGLGPSGDAGFILIPIGMSLAGATTGFLLASILVACRIALESRVGIAARRGDIPWKRVAFITAACVAATVGLQGLRRRNAIDQDRRYLLESVDHGAFAEAALEVLAHPNDFDLQLGPNPIANPRLPEALRASGLKTLGYYQERLSASRDYSFQCLDFRPAYPMSGAYELLLHRNGKPPQKLLTLQATNPPIAPQP